MEAMNAASMFTQRFALGEHATRFVPEGRFRVGYA
jgi:hypothetical protein